MSRFLAFKGNLERTVGAEQEFHLIDPATGDLVPRFDDVSAALPDDVRKRCSPELKPCLIELQTPVCRTADDLTAHVHADRQALRDACAEAGCLLAAAGSHPYAKWKQQPYIPSGHYRWVERETGYISDRMMAFGLHIHVGMDTPETTLYGMHELRRWVYPLAALLANSPFYEGLDTGLNSVRLHLFGAMPRTGLPPDVETMDDIQVLYDSLLAAQDVTAPSDLWWIIRPQPPLGTLEIRAFDLPTDYQHVGMAAALCQTAMAVFRDNMLAGRKRTALNETFLLENQWKSIRHGLDTDVIDAHSGEVLSMRELLIRFFDMLEDTAETLGNGDLLQSARHLLHSGNGATEQRRRAAAFNGDLRRLELDIAARSMS